MKISTIAIQNFRIIKSCKEISIDDFTCIIGRNNVGKSTFLKAVQLFISGDSLEKSDYHDQDNEILICLKFSEISEKDLEKIPEHRERIEPFIKNNEIKFARRYDLDGRSRLRIFKKMPKEKKFSREFFDSAFHGTRGSEVDRVLRENFPELNINESITTQGEARQLIDAYIDSLPDSEKVETEENLPSGIDNSIKKFFPEPIYIPAVKDLSDDMKSKSTTSFGKVLKILLEEIEEEFSETRNIFEDLRKKLNRVIDEENNEVDERIEKIRLLEERIQSNLSQTFKEVTIELVVPPPELKTIFANADLSIYDGVEGTIDSIGDGLKRAITFSIFRTYSELSAMGSISDKFEDEEFSGKFLLLFEEPELYLHPQAQNILFDALAQFSKKNQTIVSTHSPLFFSSDYSKTFIKMDRISDEIPFCKMYSIDLTKINTKDKFQLISFESANEAFFAEKIILVEGDSDLILFPHIAKLINPN